MLKPENLLLCLLLAVAGCSTEPPPATDWQAFNPEPRVEMEHVSEAPAIAPPPESPSPAIVRTNFNYPESWVPLERWSQEKNVGALLPLSPAPNRSFMLTAPGGEMTLYVHSLMAKWAGAEFRLGFEPQMIGNQLFVHALDLKKNIEPLLQNFVPLTRTNRLIVVDPGHGGVNAGTRSVIDGSNEKEFTLDWARRLVPLLSTNGWQVLLTRTNDVDVPLTERVAFAEEHKADLFISLHFNAAENKGEQAGLETICLTPAGMHSTFTRGYEDNPALVFANNSFDTENLQYAMRLHRMILKECGLADRGVRRARFLGVLRGQNRPAILLEGGYLSNPNEARKIAEPEFRQKLAEAVARALE